MLYIGERIYQPRSKPVRFVIVEIRLICDVEAFSETKKKDQPEWADRSGVSKEWARRSRAKSAKLRVKLEDFASEKRNLWCVRRTAPATRARNSFSVRSSRHTNTESSLHVKFILRLQCCRVQFAINIKRRRRYLSCFARFFHSFIAQNRPRDKKMMQARRRRRRRPQTVEGGLRRDNCMCRDETFFIHQAAINMSLMAPLMASAKHNKSSQPASRVRERLFIPHRAASQPRKVEIATR